MTQSDRITVFIVDDHTIVRSGLRMLLDAHPGVVVVGEAASGEDALDALSSDGDGPDLVLMDLQMSGIGGIEATRRLKKKRPALPVLFLTMTSDRVHLRDAFAAGASGYVLKDAADMELVQAIHAVAAGGRYLAPALGAELARAQQDAEAGTTNGGVSLSPREVDVLRLVALGYSNKQIAAELVISVRTVETHRAHIIQKTGLRDRSDLVRFAAEAGLVAGAPGSAAG